MFKTFSFIRFQFYKILCVVLSMFKVLQFHRLWLYDVHVCSALNVHSFTIYEHMMYMCEVLSMFIVSQSVNIWGTCEPCNLI